MVMKLAFWCCLAILVAGCGGNEDVDKTEFPAPTPEQQKAAIELKDSRDKFAFALKNQLLKEHPKENVCYSPLSIQLCLSMVLNGAAADSSDDLRKTLALDKQPIQTVNDANYTLVSALAGDSFTTANSIWLPKEIQAKPAFSTAIHDAYHGAFFTVKDFGPNTIKQINDWTSDNTKKRIPELFKELSPATCLVLVNALTFDGKWSHPFQKEATDNKPFKLLDGKSVDVPMMHQTAHFSFAQAGAKTLRMNYTGDKFSMVFILPPDGQSPSAYLGKLTEADFRKALADMTDQEVDVTLPRFELRSNYSLKDTLSAMGMSKLFEHIDLSGIADALNEKTYISQVVHQTYIKVYEEGTEAAAATGVVVTKGMAIQPKAPPTFRADRPFVYALIHNDTGAIVFLGVVDDPRG